MQRGQQWTPSVLLVDSDLTTGPEVLAILHASGYRLHRTATGLDAIQRLIAPCQPLPALVLLDTVLPDIPSSEVIDGMLRMPWTADIPIMVWDEPASSASPVDIAGCCHNLSTRTPTRWLRHLVSTYVPPSSSRHRIACLLAGRPHLRQLT